MKIIDVETSVDAIKPDGFDVIPSFKYPYCLLGFQLKNSYDQQRYFIPKKYKPVDIVHFINNPESIPLFFRGIKITPTYKLLDFIDKITLKQFYRLGNLDNETYNTTLAQCALTCEECWSYLRPGVYPIDNKFLNELCSDNINLNVLYNEIIENKDIPYFQSLGYIAIYILDNKNVVNSSSLTLKKISNI